MKTFQGRPCAPLLLLALATLLGCGGESGPPRYDVSGVVTYKGQPIPAGTIQFNPDASKNNRGPSGAATIKDGKFDTALEGRGTIGGPHRVLIEAYDGNAQPELELPHGRPLFYGYQTEIDLPKEATQIEIEVPPQSEPRRDGRAGKVQAP